jgi:S-(hydroxymethyl)glutathione dehydrogenase / alcohol dehydrogenase
MRESVLSENRLTKIPAGLPREQAALLGCAAPTGLGVVMNTAQPRPGQSLAVLGAGGIGLCAVAGAMASGCTPIIAIDVNPEKLDLARRMGATHTVKADENAAKEVAAICPGGVDFAIEATGRPEVMNLALNLVRNQGGVAVVVGNAPVGQLLSLDPKLFNMGRSLKGTWGGDSQPDRDYPRYARLMLAGRLDLSPLLSRTYSLREINQALDDLEAGRVARPLIDMSRE